MARKASTVYVCSACGFESPKWMGKCLGCGSWSTIEEVTTSVGSGSNSPSRKSKDVKISKLSEIVMLDRFKSSIEEFDRVLGGGAVRGEVLVLGGQPGIGKSTLLLSVAAGFAENGFKVLYFSAEESLEQVFRRAKRVLSSNLEKIQSNLEFVNSINTDDAQALVESKKYDVVIVDSVQAISTGDLTAVAGSVSQVRESAYRITNTAKQSGSFVILVGHVTKEGMLAGPMVLSHVVDAVFMLESENLGDLRILRGVKNRFGSIDESGIFMMTQSGMNSVKDISGILVDDKLNQNSPGIARGVLLEGVRPLLIDVQALVVKSGFSMPRRISNGMSLNRLQMLIAVLTKHLKVKLNDYDVFVNIAGGFKSDDTALDLPVCVAILSSLKNKIIPSDSAFIGEVGLTGEIRSVSKQELRVKESLRLGIKNVYPGAASSRRGNVLLSDLFAKLNIVS